MRFEKVRFLAGTFFFVIVFFASTSGCAREDIKKEATEIDPVPVAQAILAPFKANLMGSLTAALASDSTSAISVCKTRAPFLADSLSREGMQIGRTSHKLRNASNAPEEWMEPLLQSYLTGNKTDPEWLLISEDQIGYVEPIFVQSMCLACHGPKPAQAVAEEIAKLYPQDQATGFKEGDFRGLFWVTMPAHAAATDS